MHERTLMKSLLRQVEEIRRDRSADKVVSIVVSVGEFSGVEVDLLETAFRESAMESAAATAKLEINEVSLKIRCLECGKESLVYRFRFECRDCRSRRVRIVEGEALLLESVTLEGANV